MNTCTQSGKKRGGRVPQDHSSDTHLLASGELSLHRCLGVQDLLEQRRSLSGGGVKLHAQLLLHLVLRLQVCFSLRRHNSMKEHIGDDDDDDS
jgi:hypothetical protein